MRKIWAKLIVDHKVTKSIIIDIDTSNFHNGIIKICEALKIATPVITSSQINNFLEFNILKLKQRDFIETIHFDLLELNVIMDK